MTETAEGIGFGGLLGGLAADGDGFVLALPESWTQGRTAYGGLTAALCVEAARRGLPGLPPLRAAQFAFAGPASGTLRVTPRLVRQGRSAAVVAVDLDGEAGPAVRAILTHGAARESAIAHARLPAAAAPAPDACQPFFPRGMGPRFAVNFDVRFAGGSIPFSGGEPDMAVWVRHRDAAGVDPVVALIAAADAPPPASMVSFRQPGPMSTMTWGLDLVAADPGPADGWRLVRTSSEQAADGYSAQAMTIFDAAGVPVAVARQTVAVFA